ncbi:ACP S-malonyltransferase [Peptoniphilus indolicus]|uniref:Malonyl CoA-acyl carrier protein transacylase n=2 Tax=Peptoniphilus indolicus TaxID=33030 RepID=G4D461_9FIRM|nr:ACP S-malonyltransferase [Peptoniphilus indolicus]EGY79666.1 malonyl-CoA-[acyl-carrier-protein] transacylase [Peptoniphilus indolicus ATCC 29427]SUB75882.1 Polyketide biosynthesis malonyl CoA-acyl carrier protein transacylase pksC [Peptoniphilus indolicus]
MSKVAVVFGGQGSQYSGMGKKLLENYPEISNIYSILGKELSDISFNGDIEIISKTDNLQPIMLAFQLSVVKLIKENLNISATCGLSLGEYGALVLSEVIDEKAALELVKVRGFEMNLASNEVESGMLAVMNSNEDDLKNFINNNELKDRVYVANINSSKQIVISGEKTGIQKLQIILKENGIKAIPLKVSGAFHTPFMYSAAKNYKQFLKNVKFSEPKMDYYPNLSGEKYNGEEMVDLLCEQIVSPVLLYKTLKNMVDDGVDTFIEIGPGSVISSIVKKEFKGIDVQTLKNDDEIINYIERFKNGE